MARRKTVTQLQTQLQYAEARQAYKPPVREAGAKATPRAKTPLKYRVMSHPGTDALFYTIRVSTKGLEFFGDATGADLGLLPAAADGNPPRAFKPAKIHATKTVATAETKRAKASGRAYLAYTAPGGQSSYVVPVSSIEGPTGIVTIVKNLRTAKAEVLGPYGRLYFTPEFYVISD